MPPPKLGMLRLGYTNKKTKFEYRGLTREQVDEKLAEHMSIFGQETTFEGPHKLQVNRPIDHATLTAEWVEDEGTDKEKVTPVEVKLPPTSE